MSWTGEHREHHRAACTEANRRPERRRASSIWMRQLNWRMANDNRLRSKNIRRRKKAINTPEFKAIASAVMREAMKDPMRRMQARLHMAALNRKQKQRRNTKSPGSPVPTSRA